MNGNGIYCVDPGSTPGVSTKVNGPVAQLVALSAHNRVVHGSRPCGSTNSLQLLPLPPVSQLAGALPHSWGIFGCLTLEARGAG